MESCESLPKVKRKVTQHMPVRVVSDPAGEPGAACGDPEAAGQTPACLPRAVPGQAVYKSGCV